MRRALAGWCFEVNRTGGEDLRSGKIAHRHDAVWLDADDGHQAVVTDGDCIFYNLNTAHLHSLAGWCADGATLKGVFS